MEANVSYLSGFCRLRAYVSGWMSPPLRAKDDKTTGLLAFTDFHTKRLFTLSLINLIPEGQYLVSSRIKSKRHSHFWGHTQGRLSKKLTSCGQNTRE